MEETLIAKGFHRISSKKFIGDYGEYLSMAESQTSFCQ